MGCTLLSALRSAHTRRSAHVPLSDVILRKIHYSSSDSTLVTRSREAFGADQEVLEPQLFVELVPPPSTPRCGLWPLLFGDMSCVTCMPQIVPLESSSQSFDGARAAAHSYSYSYSVSVLHVLRRCSVTSVTTCFRALLYTWRLVGVGEPVEPCAKVCMHA